MYLRIYLFILDLFVYFKSKAGLEPGTWVKYHCLFYQIRIL